MLPQLAIDYDQFDIVYVDGSHRAADVYSDAALSWPMVAKDGIVIFDDYEFDQMEGELERPKLGVDVFLAVDRRAVPACPQRLSGRDRQAVARLFPRDAEPELAADREAFDLPALPVDRDVHRFEPALGRDRILQQGALAAGHLVDGAPRASNVIIAARVTQGFSSRHSPPTSLINESEERTAVTAGGTAACPHPWPRGAAISPANRSSVDARSLSMVSDATSMTR